MKKSNNISSVDDILGMTQIPELRQLASMSAALAQFNGNTVELPMTSTADVRKTVPIHLVAGLAQEVVRRLAAIDVADSYTTDGPSTEYLENLCTALVAPDDMAARRALAADASAEEIYLGHLGAAARMLGDWWYEDRVNFVQVTVGIGRIFDLLRDRPPLSRPAPASHRVSVVFASVPGEQHTLGVRMAADLFRGDGWDIALKIGLSQDELVSEITRLQKSIVGLSISGKHSVKALSQLVAALQAHCPNASVLVSGQDIDDIRPQLTEMGVDAIAHDISEAREMIGALWDRKVAMDR